MLSEEEQDTDEEVAQHMEDFGTTEAAARAAVRKRRRTERHERRKKESERLAKQMKQHTGRYSSRLYPPVAGKTFDREAQGGELDRIIKVALEHTQFYSELLGQFNGLKSKDHRLLTSKILA